MFGVDWKIWFIGFGWDDEGLLVTLGPICIWFDRRPR